MKKKEEEEKQATCPVPFIPLLSCHRHRLPGWSLLGLMCSGACVYWQGHDAEDPAEFVSSNGFEVLARRMKDGKTLTEEFANFVKQR